MAIVSGNLVAVDHRYQAYDFGPSERVMKYDMMKKLTVWRGEKDWLRYLPVAYGRGAIIDASVAYRRVISDSSDRPPYRRKDGRIILGSVVPPVRKGDHLMHIPGYGVVKTAAPIDPSWDMRSFRIVEVTGKVTHRTTPADRKFRLHITVRVPVEERRPTGIARGVDVGGHHLAVTADTDGNVAIHDTAHKRLLREIDALRGLRDRSNKGGRRWSRINKKIRRLLSKVRGLVDDTINQVVARITRGADTVAIESLSIKGMTAHGGNYKRAMNRSVRENRLGELLTKLSTKCGMRGVDLVEVPASHTSQTCHLCGHVDAKSRVNRDHFICTKCNREFHADITPPGTSCIGRRGRSSKGARRCRGVTSQSPAPSLPSGQQGHHKKGSYTARCTNLYNFQCI